MTEFVKFASTDEIKEGKMKDFSVNGSKLLIANVNGNYYSICSTCTHKGGPLADGELKGNIITCPWHGAKFDVTTGKVIGGSAKEDEKKYEVKVQGKDILVKI
ncbi:non-heme iron oxygenase ferredoxin subunit [Candidatus Woesearchaeota archaeon]|nr:non-heme iron oxygenase ferredoxin subunit [Candidatus Woesearchaeota archaeon]